MHKQRRFRLHSPLCLCLFLGWFFFFLSVVALQIPLDSKLNVGDNNNWVSSNGNFAFGFYNRSDQPNQYSVGIRFNSNLIPVSEQTVVWVAGADVIVGCDSFLHLTQTGDLVLFDPSEGCPVWTSNTSHFSVAWASLLDNGNFVLLDNGGNVLWESFRTPSDTLLPGQNLSISQSLQPASRNSVSSYYSLSMDNSGRLKLSWESSVTYWKSENSYPSISGAIFTEGGELQLLGQRLRPVWSRFGEDHNDSSVAFRFLRLDVDGNLRMYSWTNESNSWRSVWQAVDNQCKVFATCGLSSVCAFTPEGTTLCKCPFGSPSSGSNSKCLAPDHNKCSSGSSMVAIKHTFLYGVYPPNDNVTQTSLEQCKTFCLQDPLCTSVTVTNDGTGQCRMKQTTFISGYEDPSLMSISYVKVCLDPLAVLPRSLPASPPSSSLRPLLKWSHGVCIPCLVGAAAGTLVAFIVIQVGIGFWFFKRRKAVEKQRTFSHIDLSSSSRGLISLSYSEIMDLTGNFKQQLGPKVFKGMLPNNQLVAIKDLKDVEKGVSIEEKLFKCAISVIGSIHHKNLLKLEGYCCESDQRFLVYQYAKNGSVAKWIEEAKLSRRLTWRKRLEICLGVARAMSYLHMGCREFVSHGNLKWQNVVLDEELQAKVTEFGLWGAGGRDRGECGAAEHDIARFGEMVVRVVSGHHGGGDVCRWAYEEWAEGLAERVVDARIEGGVDAAELERALRIAFWCIQVDERLRPTMGEVVKVLEGTLTVDPPPSPFACRRPPGERLSDSDSEPNL
ncbi:G-type lectin S-receptor-like serine/threonine-protein kinase SD3-1 [Cinnamomum micranthum f. kanehirae]|uniref:Receptor-like serine/threonine-protein kinase n=1 Tax=Cinnamomum micranthum f. kanehirae TaxID=337451 RepID=A0A3S3PSG0_9MAGN|nr:G-type lectin S-receptor-like serine/threonine-protein kinase SD3-1 [Cinnamomum micranthum f. kanehirae]